MDSIAETTSELDVEISVVVDSGPEFRFSKSINLGIQRTRECDAWVLVNDDCTFSRDWLGKMLDAAESDPNIGLVGAVIFGPKGEIDHAGGFLTTKFTEGFREMLRRRMYAQAIRMPFRNAIFRKRGEGVEPFHYDSVNSENRLDFLTGACLLVTKELHEAIGEWDEGFRFTWEDTDYALRALEGGFELCLSTESIVKHKVRATGRKWGPETWGSGRFFREKWNCRRIEELTRGRKGIYF